MILKWMQTIFMNIHFHFFAMVGLDSWPDALYASVLQLSYMPGYVSFFKIWFPQSLSSLGMYSERTHEKVLNLGLYLLTIRKSNQTLFHGKAVKIWERLICQGA